MPFRSGSAVRSVRAIWCSRFSIVARNRLYNAIQSDSIRAVRRSSDEPVCKLHINKGCHDGYLLQQRRMYTVKFAPACGGG
jgi:hypothetical protein